MVVDGAALGENLADVIRRQWAAVCGDPGAQSPGGRWWDAVITQAGDAGLALLRSMDHAQSGGCGPVIADAENDLLLWPVPAGALHAWSHPHGTCLQGGWSSMPLPDRAGPPNPHWARPWRDDRLVDRASSTVS